MNDHQRSLPVLVEEMKRFKYLPEDYTHWRMIAVVGHRTGGECSFSVRGGR